MGAISDRFEAAFRDFVVAGVPASGGHDPVKSEVRSIGALIEVAVGAAQAGIKTVSTISDRDTFYSTATNRDKLVYVSNNNGAPADPANGVYEYAGGSARIAQGFYSGVTAAVQPLIDATAPLTPVQTAGDDNLYDPSRNLNGAYVRSDAVLDQNGDASWRVARFPVREGATYAVYLANGSTSYPVAGVYAQVTATPPYQTTLPQVALLPAGRSNQWTFTVPTGQSIGMVYFNVKVASIDVLSTFIARLGSSIPTRPLPFASAVTTFGGKVVRDETARQQIAALSTALPNGRYAGKKFYYFGDSITEGTEGGYVQFVTAILQCAATNYGSSGARASRLVGIITDQPRRDGPTDTFPLVDYANVAGITIMIGTNDSFDGNNAVTGSMADIPSQSIYDVPYTGAANASAHWQRFANTFYGNLAMCIEYALWKNPQMRVYLVVSPHLYDMQAKQPILARMNAVATAMKEIGAYYSVPVLLGHIECEITAKSKMAYSYDGVHLNVPGNQLWGAYLGYKVLNS